MRKHLNFDILESLRGFAALYVCIGHCRGVLWIGGEHYLKIHPRNTLSLSDYIVLGLNMLTRLNPEFVIVFFVLSGFSIAHSLRNKTEATPFYRRRFIRLYPPYVTAILWAMLVVGGIQLILPHFSDGTYQTPTFARLAASRDLFNWKAILLNLFYLPRLGGVLTPFWSLTFEVIFYLLAPLLFRNKRLYYAISTAMFLLVNLSYHYQWVSPSIVTEYFHFNIFFAAGIALYNNYDLVLQKAKLFTTSKALWIAAFTYVIMIGISIANYVLLNALMAGFLSVVLIVYLLSNNTRINWLITIGRFSYTLYITHFPTIFLYLALYYLVFNPVLPYIYNNLVFIPCVFLCLGVAFIQYNLVEKRSKAALDKLRKEKRSVKRMAEIEEELAV